MNTTDLSNPSNDRLGLAVAERLAKLRSMPVDTSRLMARLRDQIPDLQEAPEPAETGQHPFFLFRPLWAGAAGFIILGLILVAVLTSSGGPALASADRLAAIHEEMVAGRSPRITKVSSLQAAGAALSQQWPDAPALPDMPDDRVMACCVHEMGRKQIACVALDMGGTPVTMAVADQADVRSPEGIRTVRDGVTYRVQSSGGINMVMTERGGRWMCLMGRVPVERLTESLSQLRF